MASRIRIMCANPAPLDVAYAFSATAAGANWDPTKYYAVHVTASYDPDDANVWLTGVRRFGLNTSGSYVTTVVDVFQDGVQPDNADDVLVVTWTAPQGPPPHHYNVFIQGPNAADDKYQTDEYGNPMADSGAVTNDTLTYTITDPTDIQGTLVTSKIWSAGDSYVTIEGNHLMQFGPDTPVVVDAIDDNISTAVAHAQLSYVKGGVFTYISLDDDATGSDGELLTYRDVRHTFSDGFAGDPWYYIGSGGSSNYNQIYLDPIIQLSPSTRNRMIRDYQGYLVNRARVLDAPIEYLDVALCGISCEYGEWQQLMLYMKYGSRLLLYVEQQVGAPSYSPFQLYLCRLIDMDYLGNYGKNSRNRYNLRFEIEEMKYVGEYME